MSKLQWISEKDLNSAIGTLCKRAEKALNNAKVNQEKNKIDSFHSLLITNIFKIKQESELVDLQGMTSASHGISNAIGTFHQSILGSVSGWKDHDSGYDLENSEEKILAEIKNKHNTIKGNTKKDIIKELSTALRQKKEGCWKGYLVIILPKNPKTYKNILEKLGNNKELYEIDGMSFYEMVTGDKNALNDLFNVLCDRLNIGNEVTSYCKEIMANNYGRIVKKK